MRVAIFLFSGELRYAAAMENAIPEVYSDPLAHWFVTEAYRITDTAEFVTAAGEHLVAAGIPVYRMAYFQTTLHPELSGKSYTWRCGGKAVVGIAPRGLESQIEYRSGPLPVVIEQRKRLRYRLEEIAPQDLLFNVLRDLKTEGCTDYVAQPLVFSTGQVDALSLVSNHPGGFSKADLDRLYLLHYVFSRITEIHSLRDTAEYLLDAYVGRAAGRRILAGEIERGTGQTIEAVIWYCDLRGFTTMSDRLPRDAIIALLNDYFGVMGSVVTEAGGEILKFMGDGMLAIFPVDDPDQRPQIVTEAVGATGKALSAVAELNARRIAAGDQPVRFGLALHLGEVMFGNIGASARLDFTVIGPAVNHAARLEKLCTVTDCPVVLSSAIAALLPKSAIVSLGSHVLRGVDEAQEVFTPSTPTVRRAN